MNHKPLIDKACEARELTKEDFAEFKPASEIAPELELEVAEHLQYLFSTKQR